MDEKFRPYTHSGNRDIVGVEEMTGHTDAMTQPSIRPSTLPPDLPIERLPNRLRSYFADQQQLSGLVDRTDTLHGEIKRTFLERETSVYALASRGARLVSRMVSGKKPQTLEELFLAQRENTHDLIAFGQQCIGTLAERDNEMLRVQYEKLDKSRRLHEGYKSLDTGGDMRSRRKALLASLELLDRYGDKYHQARRGIAEIDAQLRRLGRAERVITDEMRYVESDLPNLAEQLDLIGAALDMTTHVVQNAFHVCETVDRAIENGMVVSTSMALVRRLHGEIIRLDPDVTNMQRQLSLGLERMVAIIER